MANETNTSTQQTGTTTGSTEDVPTTNSTGTSKGGDTPVVTG